jgi:oligopeptide/dipeptide ABC transporter ATP-binding protein
VKVFAAGLEADMLLEVKNLTVVIYRNGKFLEAVNNISFNIDEGEILGILGESGCGKTLTALSIPNLISENKKILHGDIIYNNINLTNLDDKEMRSIRGKEISMIFQEVRQSLNPLIKVGSQITEILELGGGKNAENNKKKVLETLISLSFDEPERIFNAYPHQLSGGMCQRIMTAIAAISNPRLLIADEPSSALDMQSQERILSLLSKMNRENKTSILIISHDLSIIREFTSRFLVMYAGRIVEEGLSKNLSCSLHPYTQALMKAIPDKSKRGKKIESIPGKVPTVEDTLPGCPFAPRCKKAGDICREAFPPKLEFKGQYVNCHFPLTGESCE